MFASLPCVMLALGVIFFINRVSSLPWYSGELCAYCDPSYSVTEISCQYAQSDPVGTTVFNSATYNVYGTTATLGNDFMNPEPIISITPIILNTNRWVRIQVTFFGYWNWVLKTTADPDRIIISDSANGVQLLSFLFNSLTWEMDSFQLRETTEIIFMHPYNDISIQLTSICSEDINQLSWGFNNLLIQYGECLPNCATCPDPTVCQLCYAGYYNDVPSRSCVAACPSSASSQNEVTFQCDYCDITCLTCDGSNANNCLTCTGTNFYDSTLHTCYCPATHYYSQSPINCLACDPTCLTCNGTNANNCLSCDGTNFWDSTLHTCTCPTTHYYSASTISCVACDATCLTCNGPNANNCLSCDGTNFWDSMAHTCTCPSTNYYSASTISCVACDATCLTCNGPNANNCLTCVGTNFWESTLHTCYCPTANYYPVSTTDCQPCDPTCLTCNGIQSNNCLTCAGTNQWDSGSLTCSCPIDHYYSATSIDCLPCDVTCLNCNGPNANNCLMCDGTNQWDSGLLTCSCPSTHYYSPTIIDCFACDVNCLTCNGPNANNCLSCVGPNIWDSTLHTCSCPTTHYYPQSTTDCFACDSSCLTCSDGVSCDTCDSGYFVDSTTHLCVPCAENCENCVNISTNCSSCSSSKNREQVGTNCQCMTSYFERSASNSYDPSLTRIDYNTSLYGACIACNSGCTTCTNESTICDTTIDSTECDETETLYQGQCSCKIEYELNSSTGKCEKPTNTATQLIAALQEQATVAVSGVTVSVIPSLILGNPALVLQALTIIQIIKYILFLEVRYPSIVETFFELFDQTDGKSLQSIFLDFNDNKMRPSSDGFYQHDVSGLFIADSGQILKSLLIQVILYSFVKILYSQIVSDFKTTSDQNQHEMQNKSIKDNQIEKTKQSLTALEVSQIRLARLLSRQQMMNPNLAEEIQIKKIMNEKAQNNRLIPSILKKVIDNLEWGSFLGVVEAGFLNLCTFTFLQLQNASVITIPQVISFLLAFVALSVLVGFIITVYVIVMKLINSTKSFELVNSNNEKSYIVPLATNGSGSSNDLSEEEISNLQKLLQSFTMIHMLFMPGVVLKQGYYIVLLIRKFIFAMSLVFLYKTPILTLIVWIALNISLVGILIKHKPYKEFIYNVRDVLTELLFCIIHLLTFPLTSSSFVDDISNQSTYNQLGSGIFVCICAIIVVQISCIIFDSIMQIKKVIKKEPPIPPTPVISQTPSLSRQSSDNKQNTQFEDKNITDDLEFADVHFQAMNDLLNSEQTKKYLNEIHTKAINSQSHEEFTQRKAEYHRLLFCTKVATSLSKINQLDSVDISFELKQVKKIIPNSQSVSLLDDISNKYIQDHSLQSSKKTSPRISPEQKPAERKSIINIARLASISNQGDSVNKESNQISTAEFDSNLLLASSICNLESNLKTPNESIIQKDSNHRLQRIEEKEEKESEGEGHEKDTDIFSKQRLSLLQNKRKSKLFQILSIQK